MIFLGGVTRPPIRPKTRIGDGFWLVSLLLARFIPSSGLLPTQPLHRSSRKVYDLTFPVYLPSRPTVALFCQLLGMNCAVESEIALAWLDFCERGGTTDIHSDGWGLAYYAGNTSQGLRQFHDVEAASTSALAQFLGQQSIRTRNLLAHIRYATSGRVDLANVHPFAREMWALNWCFCHNGQVPLFDDHPDHVLGSVPGERYYYPVGETDSERTFCAILNALRAQFTDTMPSLPDLFAALQAHCREIVDYDRSNTILNFLLTCGPHVLWVYSWPGKRPGSEVWNGLHYVVRKANDTTNFRDEDISVRFQTSEDGVDVGDDICIVATKPLDDSDWIELNAGELVVLDNGIPYVTARDLFHVELKGHGLNNFGKALRPARLAEDMRRYEFVPDFFVGGGI